MDLKAHKKEFYQSFGREDDYPAHVFFAPGRVCLIGEHIDYNGGLVMPAAISLGVHGVYRREDNDIIWMRSTIDKRDVVFHLGQDIVYDKERAWGNYPLAVIHYLRQHGVKIRGCEILFHTDLPMGAGLSSSAAVEVLTAYIFSQLDLDLRLDKVILAQLAQRAEKEFVGVNCGIMDQFAVAMGKKNHAMVLNCDTLEHEYVPLVTDEYAVVVMNSNKTRELTESKFNERTSECEEALRVLQRNKKIRNLAEAEAVDIRQWIADPLLRKRALHVAVENQRVKMSADALRAGDLVAFGKLMTDSHQSLKENYEVSGFELDTLVEAAVAHPACLGAKMTGAGFGGCAVALVKRTGFKSFKEKVGAKYLEITGREADIFQVEIADGVRRLEEDKEPNKGEEK